MSVHENAYFCGRDVENIDFAPKKPIWWCKRGANGEKKSASVLIFKHLHFVGYPEPVCVVENKEK